MNGQKEMINRTLRVWLVSFALLCAWTQGHTQQIEVGEIDVLGNKQMKVEFVKKLVGLSVGDIVDSVQIETTIKRLKRLPAVYHAYFKLSALTNGQSKLTYYIEENITLIPSFNIYTAQDEAIAYNIGLTEYNLFGQGITLGGYYQKDIFGSYSFNLRHPYLFSRKLGLSLCIQNLTSQEPVFFDNTTADYKYNNRSYELTSVYQLDFNHSIELGVNLFTERYEYISGATREDIPRQLKAQKALGKIIYTYNKLNYHFQYISGFKSIFILQYVTSQNNALPDFLIGWNDFLFFKRIKQKGNLAARVRLGIASNSNSPFAPFTVDNNVNIRGVGNEIDRGTAAAIFNIEYRRTLLEKKWLIFQGVLFTDAGSWRQPGGPFSDFVDQENIRVYSGLGVRFILPKVFNAVFRMDYGLGLGKNDGQGLVFGVGQYF